MIRGLPSLVRGDTNPFDPLPAGRTPGCERGSRRPCGWRRRLASSALSADAARQPPAATVGQRVNVQGDRLAEATARNPCGPPPRPRSAGGQGHRAQRGAPSGRDHLRELVGLKMTSTLARRCGPRGVSRKASISTWHAPRAPRTPLRQRRGAGRIVVDVGVIAQVRDGFGSLLGHQGVPPAG